MAQLGPRGRAARREPSVGVSAPCRQTLSPPRYSTQRRDPTPWWELDERPRPRTRMGLARVRPTGWKSLLRAVHIGEGLTVAETRHPTPQPSAWGPTLTRAPSTAADRKTQYPDVRARRATSQGPTLTSHPASTAQIPRPRAQFPWLTARTTSPRRRNTGHPKSPSHRRPEKTRDRP